MLRSQGIDANIDRTMDAFRGKEGQLNQRYNMSKNLIDLLALQKLKTEQDSKAREIQLSMEQSPETVKQQMEGEMLERSRQEVVKQTSGLLGQAQKQKQQNMQRQGQQPPVGIEGMMMAAAGGPVKKFSKGGITQADIDAYRQKLRGRKGQPNQLLKPVASLTDAQIIEMIKKDQNRAQMNMPMGQVQAPFKKLGQTTPNALAPTSTAQAQTQVQTPVAPPDITDDPFLQMNPAQVKKDLNAAGISTPSGGDGSVTQKTPPVSGADALRGRIAEIEKGRPTDTGYTPNTELETRIKELAGKDPDAAYEASIARGKALGLDPETVTGKFDALAKRRKEETGGIQGQLETLYGDPKRNKREQYMAMLAGGAGGGRSLADFGRGMYTGLYGTRDKQRENTRANLLKGSELLDKELALSSDGIKQGVSAGQSLFQKATDASNSINTLIGNATQAWQGLEATEQRNFQANAKIVTDSIDKQVANELAIEANEISKLNIQSRDDATAINAANEIINRSRVLRDKARKAAEDAFTSDPKYAEYAILKMKSPRSPEEEKRFKQLEGILDLMITSELAKPKYGNLPEIESQAQFVLTNRFPGVVSGRDVGSATRVN